MARLESPVDGWVSHLEFYERELRQEICPGLERKGFETHVEVVAGDPAREIVRIAEERGAGGYRSPLVVLGTHGRGWLSEVGHGSVSHEIVRRAHASILLVPSPRAGPAIAGYRTVSRQRR